MTVNEKYFVECKAQTGAILQIYDFTVVKEMTAPLDETQLINEAKTNLTSQGLAHPPYTGISFRIYR